MGGGLAIWLGVLAPFLLGSILLLSGTAEALLPAELADHLEGVEMRLGGLWILLAGGTALMILGLLDDLRGLAWQLRLSIQLLIVAACIGSQGWQVSLFMSSGLVTVLVSIFWVVLLINSFNMLDNMDGASAGVAAIAALVLSALLIAAALGARALLLPPRADRKLRRRARTHIFKHAHVGTVKQ